MRFASRVCLLPPGSLIKTSPLDQAQWNYSHLLGWIQKRRFDCLLQLMEGRRFTRLLEVGYGSGILMPELATRTNELFGVDVHRQASGVEAVLRKHGVRARLSEGRAEEIPFASGFFDSVVVVSALEFVDDMRAVARELARVLTPEGLLFVITPGSSKIADLGLKLLTGRSALEDFGKRRSKVLPELLEHFQVERSLEFPRLIPVTLYHALRLTPR